MEKNIIIKVPVRKWGNSQAIRIPKNYLDSLGIKENEPVLLSLEDESIVIKKSRKFNSLKERLETFYGKTIDDIFIENTQEIDWGAPEGEEVW
jgi:antitoxin MazE